ncbi:D-alanine--poly(phosphoribitol) ligase subunit 1 [Clostridium saccharobutylicum]|uniref:D-alanine--poly(phosphoribitol) ligase subunit DltA n=1 Tax=Clostridium saccharobutylicum TaxID=169679 RepID=UPI000983A46B|nr:D-alanine--poly(phosphoribitol) ligase subunit DltA [Clostridium saccharobutylicum]AQS12064.1 D-alanine--poly(phosphoribitol) ligase subunit 1 [Clostridium saccharobutylicum]MBC2435761.1 D-alanine--poly(phosphoribitol) ligase subunit DltA [Clostridium saccharobutylicum]NSB87176.1 D-alanine--poly(phosphoribitol) ligase subunit 1 [Clostridium saccharobutylicum]NYC29916.1 D-alanine--poly(phosphoribitol) ligase subunit 1 [Clostridium saccharobutylicum]OOM18593.1 D-alanine--poly(phosphoribitol) 
MKILDSIEKFAKTERAAVKCLGNELTYKELNENSDKIAKYLLEEFKSDRTPIIIYGNKENEILPIMIGALKSGRAYVPLDITFPEERVNQIIKEINPKVIFNFTQNNLKTDDALEINLDQLKDILKCEISNLSRDTWVKDDDNCYILFTSGSTGKPKGVQISKKNIDSFTQWFEKYLNFDESPNTILNQISYSFDVSVIPIYIGLGNGKTLFSLNKDTLEDLKELFNQLINSHIDCWVSTPALAEMCSKFDDFNDEKISDLTSFVFAGEVLTKKLIGELTKRFSKARIINGYGPTEATVLISAIDINKQMIESEKSIPIGYPIENCELSIIDKNGNKVKDGEKGELIVIGDSVSKGYLNNPEMTNKAFFKSADGKQGYKTGDLAYYEEGIIYYCGRKDFQIKLNGFRIEIEDIENNLRKVNNINNAVVFPVFNEERKISHLTAFVVLNEENELSNLKKSILIKNELKKLIPSYMIPRNVKILKEFPLNTNGKIDRKKLMEAVK